MLLLKSFSSKISFFYYYLHIQFKYIIFTKVSVASAQCTGHGGLDARAHVRIWHAVNLATLRVIGTSGTQSDFANAVTCLSFSKWDGGALLCCVDDANDKYLSVWQWQTGKYLFIFSFYIESLFDKAPI